MNVKISSEVIEEVKIISRPLPITISSVIDYIIGRRTPARILNDEAIKELMAMLTGKIVEVGAAKTENYMRFAPQLGNYIMTNISPNDNIEYLDVMNIHYEDNSVDNFVCFSVLEHINNPIKAIKEMYRVLKPGGKLFLIVPFVFPFHAAPDDFYRFSPSAISDLLKDFHIIHFEALGNYYSTMALFLQRPRWRGWPWSVSWWPWAIFLRFVGLIFILLSHLKKEPDDYAMLYCVVAGKPNVGGNL